MNWENLKTHTCPYCSGPMFSHMEYIKCSRCRFTISKLRRNMIVENTMPNGGPMVKIKWQLLHDKKCPICANDLVAINDTSGTNACIKKGCDFRISQMKLEHILLDPLHPANRYKGKYANNRQI